MALRQRCLNDTDRCDRELDKSRSRPPRELEILFEGDDAPHQDRDKSCFVSSTSPDDQRRVGALHRRRLQ